MVLGCWLHTSARRKGSSGPVCSARTREKEGAGRLRRTRRTAASARISGEIGGRTDMATPRSEGGDEGEAAMVARFRRSPGRREPAKWEKEKEGEGGLTGERGTRRRRGRLGSQTARRPGDGSMSA